MKKSLISVEDFANAFSKATRKQLNPEIIKMDSNSSEWTKIMISKNPNSVISTVYEELTNLHDENTKLEFEHYLNIDAVICSKKPFWTTSAKPAYYPLLIYVAIEHENSKYPQPEMWKLAFIRSQLKVLINYDEKINYRANDFSDKLNTLCKEGVVPEGEEYLLIMAPKNTDKTRSEVPWRYFKIVAGEKYVEFSPEV